MTVARFQSTTSTENSNWKHHTHERLRALLTQISVLVTMFGDEILFSSEGVGEFQRVGWQGADAFGAFFEEPSRILGVLERFDTTKGGDLFAYLKGVAKKDWNHGENPTNQKARDQANRENPDAFNFENGEERSVDLQQESSFDPAIKLELQEEFLQSEKQGALSKEILEALPELIEDWAAQHNEAPKKQTLRLKAYRLVYQSLLEQSNLGKPTRTAQGFLSLGAGAKEQIADKIGVTKPTSRNYIKDFQTALERLREDYEHAKKRL
jgi:hypothetical protein